jgi:hypothetical protein
MDADDEPMRLATSDAPRTPAEGTPMTTYDYLATRS